MSIIKKNRALELCENLIQNNNKIKDLSEMQIYISCQEAAISLGNYLEIEGEMYTEIIGMLEEYCEYIYQLLSSKKDKNTSSVLKKNHTNLQLLKAIIEKKMPASKKLIVFLPYKASMWDSMESIWKAAMQDDSCIVHVVPIPYFDKMRNGTLGIMHDECNQYPIYVSVMNWKNYDIALNKPDVLYVHNPYDNHNYSTTIHPKFYITEIKKYVGTLVYIPYFVVPFNHMKSNLCILSGTLFSDYIIVQSKEVKQFYLKELKQFEKEKSCFGQFGNLEKKILALGSPKYDKVLQAKKSDYLIPEEWKQIILKKDQKNIKMILFNTSITSMLENGWDMVYKIEKVLEIFEKQKNIVLLWRPHPLFLAVLETIKPELIDFYMKIVEKYCKESWGIYDESDNLNRAIAISDAYYGDGGSLLELYRITGKPIMIFNIEVKRNKQGVEDGADMV